MSNPQKKQSGFIALITAIILSLILILVTVTINQIGAIARVNSGGSEYKEQSMALAKSCAPIALLHLTTDRTYTGNETISTPPTSCDIKTIQLNTPSAGLDTIPTKAIFHEATTNLSVIIHHNDLSIVSSGETP